MFPEGEMQYVSWIFMTFLQFQLLHSLQSSKYPVTVQYSLLGHCLYGSSWLIKLWTEKKFVLLIQYVMMNKEKMTTMHASFQKSGDET